MIGDGRGGNRPPVNATEETTMSDRDYLYGHVCAHGEYQLRDAIREHMDASYDPPSVADMALWAHIMDQEDARACTDGLDGDVAARG